MRRTAFKPKMPEARHCRQYGGTRPDAPRTPARRVVDQSAAVVTPLVKPEAAKPGKRPPTKVEARWMHAVVEFGCVACHIDGVPPRPTAVHHLLRGGRRIAHLFTIGLCDPGHHQSGEQFGMISRHPTKARFERRYGPESHLLAVLQRKIGAAK